MDNIFAHLSESFVLLGNKIYNWLDTIVLSFPNIILVLVTLIIGIKLMKFAKRLINKLAIKSFSANVGVQQLINNVGAVLLYAFLGILLLTILGLKGPITAVLASAGVAGLALGLALQDPLMNLFSGIIMSVKQVFSVGDFVETNGYLGGVQAVSLNSTVIRMLSGEEVNIPNKLVLQHPVKNLSANGLRRVEFNCGISYNEDLELVKRISTDAVKHLAINSVTRPVEFIYTGFGASSIDFQIRFWTNPKDIWEYLEAKSIAIIKLKQAFDQHNITIPFPIRTLEFGKQEIKDLGRSFTKIDKPN